MAREAKRLSGAKHIAAAIAVTCNVTATTATSSSNRNKYNVFTCISRLNRRAQVDEKICSIE